MVVERACHTGPTMSATCLMYVRARWSCIGRVAVWRTSRAARHQPEQPSGPAHIAAVSITSHTAFF